MGVRMEIPHGQDHKVYEAILAGEPVQYSMTSRRRKMPDKLEADGEMLALEPPGAKRRRGPGSVQAMSSAAKRLLCHSC